MFILSIFFSLTYFICSLQLKNVMNLKIPHNFIGKMLIRTIRFVRNFYPKFSFKLFFDVLDYVKCPIFVIASAIIFDKKQVTDLTAVISYMAHYFPIWSGFRNDNKNFIGIILTGFILDPITGISMIFAYLVSARGFGYTSVSITSSMMVGMIKTVVHIVFFDNTDYIEAFFFIFFGSLAIYKNRKVLLYICEKSVKKDIKLFKYKKMNETKKTFETTDRDVQKMKKNTDKCDKKTNKKGFLYRNYKKFYISNQKFTDEERRYN